MPFSKAVHRISWFQQLLYFGIAYSSDWEKWLSRKTYLGLNEHRIIVLGPLSHLDGPFMDLLEFNNLSISLFFYNNCWEKWLSRIDHFGPNRPSIIIFCPESHLSGPFMNFVDFNNFSSSVLLIVVIGRSDSRENPIFDQMGIKIKFWAQ